MFPGVLRSSKLKELSEGVGDNFGCWVSMYASVNLLGNGDRGTPLTAPRSETVPLSRLRFSIPGGAVGPPLNPERMRPLDTVGCESRGPIGYRPYSGDVVVSKLVKKPIYSNVRYRPICLFCTHLQGNSRVPCR